MSANYSYYKNQNYEKIKAECLKNKKLFEDDIFPANDSSLFRFNRKENIKWKRPSEFLTDVKPEFIVDKIAPDDISQGELGDCWFISSMSAVSNVKEYIEKVIPVDQTFEGDQYCGLFRFRFYLQSEKKTGDWIEVCVDDRLPVNEDDALIYCQNKKDTNEMFAPLLEKAYAKLNLCYEFLDGGDIVDGIVDLTGGIHERLKAVATDKITDDTIWEIMFKAFQLKSLAGASMDVKPGQKQEDVLKNGLVTGHAYSILDTIELVTSKDGIYDSIRRSYTEKSNPNHLKLVRLRNPWGEKDSYNGPWSLNSSEWKKVSDTIRKDLNYQDDGEFFMSFKDFMSIFDDIDFVHINLNAFYIVGNDYHENITWDNFSFSGEWVKGKTAGGCGNDNIADFFKNPQFPISLKYENENQDKVSIIVFLIQTDTINRRSMAGKYEDSNLQINISIYKITNSDKGNRKKYSMEDLEEIYSGAVYLNIRSVSARLDLEPGDYVIIPSTFNKDAEGKFLLKVFVEGKYNQNGAKIEFKKIEPNVNDKKKVKPEKRDKDTERDSNKNRNRDNDLKKNEKKTGDDIENQADDGVNQADDGLNQADDELNHADDGLNQADDELNHADDGLNQADDELNQIDDEENQRNNGVVISEESSNEEEEEMPPKPIKSRDKRFNYNQIKVDEFGQVVSRGCSLM